MAAQVTDELTQNALKQALLRRNPPKGLIHHSDRGVQYASGDYQELLKRYQITPSMSRKGDCWDNAVGESFVHTLKEAGNAKVRNELLKRNMTDEQIINAHLLCQKYGIKTFTNCIVGLPGTSVKDDIESIDLAIKCKVDWAEFLIYHPYPKTDLGERCIQLKMYVPDYDKMHTSYMYNSPLNCFIEKDKNVYRNLSCLGAAAVVLPQFRGFIVNHLIRWRHNRFFTFIFYVIKMYIIRNKIYVTKTSFWNSMLIFLRSLKQELFRHESKDSADDQ